MRPEWLWALMPAIVLAGLLWRLRYRSGSWSSVIAPDLLPYLIGDSSGPRKRNFTPALLLIWALAALGAAGPSFKKIPQPVHQKQDALVLVLDLSYSMMAADLAPSRNDRARQKLLDLLSQRKEGQTGLIAYAGDAHIVTPLTDDNPTIANLLPALNPGMMPLAGSEPAAALSQAVELMYSAGVQRGRIMLVTDGITEQDREEISELLQGSGMGLVIMGIGTATGAPLPLPKGGFLKDDSGTIVMPALEEDLLRRLARDTAGRYMRLQIDDSDLDYLLADDLLAIPEQTMVLDRAADAWEDQGHLLILLLLPVVLSLFRKGWIVCLLPLMFAPLPQTAHADVWDDLWLTPDQQGQRALQQGNNEAAANLFEDNNWAGTAAYQSGDYERATQSFTDKDSADTLYNLGNALAKAGQIDQAIETYQESLKIKPEQQDAIENLALLEKLQQEQEQQQEQSDQQDKQDQENQENQDQNQNQDQQKDEQNQDQQQQDSQSDDQQPSDQNSKDKEEQASESPQDQPEEQEKTPEQEEASRQENEQQQEALDEAIAQAQQEDLEKDQAMEQWLRRIPDDPSGLLRQKFRYESQQRQQQGKKKDDETYW
ncbi:VWA domain-containing protein [Halieaceae bacterium IMCC8485]|uniref:VWA domain-containing protein n=2 Tax=Candidatus Seongchinamella marina TaxID=2518990 RepID=A0ABT3SWG6_9GAMM|nr:VWA domain-containing protein [Candidatus Seongchinamella marina]